MKGMSERQYAERVGMSRGGIRTATDAGRIVLHNDGSIDPEASDARRAAQTDPTKGRAWDEVKAVRDAAIEAVDDVLREQGITAFVEGEGRERSPREPRRVWLRHGKPVGSAAAPLRCLGSSGMRTAGVLLGLPGCSM